MMSVEPRPRKGSTRRRGGWSTEGAEGDTPGGFVMDVNRKELREEGFVSFIGKQRASPLRRR